MDREPHPEPKITQEQAAWLEIVEERLNGLRDPKMDRVIQAARAADEMTHIIPMTSQEHGEVIADLDAEWRRWQQQPVSVSGRLSYRIPREGQDPIIGQTILWDQRLISYGFNIHSEGEPDAQGRRFGSVIYQFALPVELIPEHIHTTTNVAAFAGLDDITIDSMLASKERSYSWLRTMYPGFIEEIDSRINDSMSEADAIIELAKVDLSTINLDDELARNCVEAYIRSHILVDKKVPYGLLVNGEVSHENFRIGKRISYHVENMKMIASVSSIKVFARTGDTGSDAWHLGLRVKSHQQDRRIRARKYNVPLSSVELMVSLRDEFFTG